LACGLKKAGDRFSPMSLKCVIVEDQTMFRQMLHNMLQSVPNLTVAATAQSVASGLAACVEHNPDLLVLDLALPDGSGLEVARWMAKHHPQSKTIILSGEASTFVCPPDLVQQIHAVLDKTQAFDDLASELKALLPKARGGSSMIKSETIPGILSTRELEIFLLIGRGMMSKEIGETLGISPLTVQTHRKKIAEKLGTSGPELGQLALRHYHATLGARS
jgi:DNA-binding NarL/FixJ family response regulator